MSPARSLDAGGASDYVHNRAKTTSASPSAAVTVPSRAVAPGSLTALPTPTIAPNTSLSSFVKTNNNTPCTKSSLSQIAYGRHVQLTCIDQLMNQFANSPLAAELARDPWAILKHVMVVYITGIAHPIYAACTFDGIMFVHLVQDATSDAGLHKSDAFRKAVVAILELAEDTLDQGQLIASVHPSDKPLALALRYVGFELVSPQVVAHDTSKCALLAYSM